MISDLIKPGNKVELNIESSTEFEDEGFKDKKLFSSVYDLDEENVIIYMPMKKGQYILIPNNMAMEMMIHSARGIFKCNVRVRERYKKGNIFLMSVELQSGLTKYQRRDFYRCDCLIDFDFRIMSENRDLGPLSWANIDEYIDDEDTSDIYSGTILDISGGGMRFSTKQKVDKGRIILLSFTLEGVRESYDMLLLGEMLSCVKDELLPIYEERVQFVQINESEREKIVKFIFEEERRARSIRKG